MEEWFAYEGRLVQILNKAGELIMLSVLFLLCCIPVVTAGAAVASLYYAVMKSIRRERGGPVQEFLHSMKRTAGRGCLFTLEIGAAGILLRVGYVWAQTAQSRHMQALYIGLGLVLACVSVYVFPVLSRFELRAADIWKLSFVMAIRFLPFTAGILVGTAAVVWVWFYWLPALCILVIPGCWCLLVTFPMERALLAYTPEAKGGEQAWYDKPENRNNRKEKE